MAKLKTLQGAPKNFELSIGVDNLDGTQSEILFQCIGRTLRDWQPIYLQRLAGEANAKIDAQEKIDQQTQAQEPEQEPKKGKKKDTAAEVKRIEFDADEIRASLETSLDSPVEIIQEVATGWDLDDAFTPENLKELISRYPGTQAKLFQLYHERIVGNRTKKLTEVGEALYSDDQLSSPANLAMLHSLGIRPEDYADQDALEVWPENTQAVNFFIEYCATQWRTGMGGATGLDYSAVIAALQWLGFDKEVFEQVRCIERGALDTMAERRKRDEAGK